LNSIVPSAKTLIFVLPVSMEAEPVSASADIFACRTHNTPLSFAAFFAGAALAAGTAIAQATTKKRIKRRMKSHFPSQ